MRLSTIPTYKIHLNKTAVQDRYVYRFLKRLFGTIFSAIAIILLSPFIAIIAIKIKAFDKGSVFFKQTRIGMNEKPFTLYKFRTMHEGSDDIIKQYEKENQIKGAMFKIKDDPRITPFGKFLRRHSFDELPQLFNVIKGDMALIGPRPPLPREVENYTDYDMQIFYVKPGCSGLWQVTYRNEISFSERIQQDLYYIDHANIF